MDEPVNKRLPSAAQKPPWISVAVIMAMGLALLNAFISESTALMLVDLRQQMDLSHAQASLLRFAPAAAGLLIAPSAGAITDGLGAKRSLSASLILFGLGGLLIALSNTASSLIVGLLVLGLGQMSATVIGYALLTKSAATPKQLGLYLAAWTIVWNLGFLVFPPITGMILTQTVRSWNVIGQIVLASSLCLFMGNTALMSHTLNTNNGCTNGWDWMISLGVVFSLSTALPILHGVDPKLTPVVLGVDLGIAALLIWMIKRSPFNQQQLRFLANPTLVLAMLAVAATYCIDWNYYSERFITLRYGLHLDQTTGWLTPANAMAVAGASLFGLVSTNVGVLQSTAGALLIWLLCPLAFILTTPSTGVVWTAASVALFTLLECYTYTGLETLAASHVPKANLGTFSSLLVGLNTTVKSAGGALTTAAMTNAYQITLRDKLEPLPLSSDQTTSIIHWLSEGRFQLALDHDTTIPGFIVNTHLLPTSPLRIGALIRSWHVLGHLIQTEIVVIALLFIASVLQQRHHRGRAAVEP